MVAHARARNARTRGAVLWPSDANLLGWKTRVIAAGVVDADSVLAPGVYAENWRSPLVGHPPNQGPDDCSDIPVEDGTAEVVAGRTFYAVIASKEQYNRFTGTPATEAWLDVIFWDYDPAGGRAVKMVNLLPIGFVPGSWYSFRNRLRSARSRASSRRRPTEAARR